MAEKSHTLTKTTQEDWNHSKGALSDLLIAAELHAERREARLLRTVSSMMESMLRDAVTAHAVEDLAEVHPAGASVWLNKVIAKIDGMTCSPEAPETPSSKLTATGKPSLAPVSTVGPVQSGTLREYEHPRSCMCAGAGWLWAHEVGDHVTDQRYPCPGVG